MLLQSFCCRCLAVPTGIDSYTTGVIVWAGLSFTSLRLSHNCSYSEKGKGSQFSSSCCKWVIQIAAVRGKIGNPGAECKFGHVDKRVIDKQELQEGSCWRRRWLSCTDVHWRGGRKSWLAVRLCSRCHGGGGAIGWGTGHRAVLMWTKGWENKAVRWCTVFCSPSAKLICSYGFFSTCHWHLLIATNRPHSFHQWQNLKSSTDTRGTYGATPHPWSWLLGWLWTALWQVHPKMV